MYSVHSVGKLTRFIRKALFEHINRLAYCRIYHTDKKIIIRFSNESIKFDALEKTQQVRQFDDLLSLLLTTFSVKYSLMRSTGMSDTLEIFEVLLETSKSSHYALIHNRIFVWYNPFENGFFRIFYLTFFRTPC